MSILKFLIVINYFGKASSEISLIPGTKINCDCLEMFENDEINLTKFFI